MNIDPQISNVASLINATAYDATHGNNSTANARDDSADHARWNRMPKPRGRQPKDPHAQTIRFTCRDIADQERQLRDYLQAPTAPAEHATIEFAYPVSSAFMVYSSDLRATRNKQQDERSQHLYGKLDRTAVSIIDALTQTEDAKDQMRRQKSIAKVCVEACEKVDGYRYSFHNNWLSREDEACRFSYFCNDSTLNKGRAANEGAGTEGKKMRKPVYDCQGTIAVKFSQTKQSLEVHYRHIPLHQTYIERAPPPRKDSKRYKLMEVFEPDKLPVARDKRPLQNMSDAIEGSGKPRKRRATEPPARTSSADTRTTPTAPVMNLSVDYTASSSDRSENIGLGRSNQRTRSYRGAPSLALNQSTQAQSQTHGTSKRMTLGLQPSAHLHSASQDGHDRDLTWTDSDNVDMRKASAAPAIRRDDHESLRGVATAAATIDNTPTNATFFSDFEALKAKLEAAEERIKKLEAEKQTMPQANQSAMWNPYHLTPSQVPYPYPYPPPGYTLTPQAMMQPGISHVLPNVQPILPPPAQPHQTPYASGPSPVQAPYSEVLTPTSATAMTAGPEPKSKRQHSQAKAKQAVTFVPYKPKTQGPVLNVQRQDAGRVVGRPEFLPRER